MVDSNDGGYRLLHFLDMIDFVIRDAHYINLFSLRINLILFIKSIKISKDGEIDAPSDINVIGSYYRLLSEKVYQNPKIIAIENIFSRIIVNQLLKKNVSLDDLLEWTDDDLNRILNDKKYKIGGDEYSLEEIVSQIKTNSIYHVFLNNIYSNSKNPLEIEKKFVHKNTPSIFNYHETDGYFLTVEKADPFTDETPLSGIYQDQFKVHTFSIAKAKDPKKILQIAVELMGHQEKGMRRMGVLLMGIIVMRV